METILLVEDDAALSEGIALAFSQQPYEFVRCASLADAWQALQTRAFSLILLDLGLPDGNGLELCRQLRDRRDPVPVLFLTANDTEYSEVAALEAGGDDYITKPFSLAVLRARVTAALRRRTPAGLELVEVGPFRFDFARLRFERQGVELALSRTEQRLLQLLVKNRGQIVPRDTLLDQVWDGGEFVDENTLSVAVRRLRAKLEEDPRRPRYIQTVYGVGYTWKGNADE
ncbi:response regulator transcription factor [Fournierella sp.]|uniref:response regulator transcription factor n=1 Tax=Allofournierella sp. TaxID=1940256 RepID=UPI003079B78A